MSESWKQALLEELRQRGIVDEADAAAVIQQSPAPWFVHLFAGLAAWLAALMLTLSTALALAHDSLFGAILIGAMLLGLAVWLLRQSGIFLAQMGLALSLAGQGMLVYAVGDLSGFDGVRSCALSGAVVALGMLWVPAPALHRVLCALGVFAGIAVLIGFNGWLSLYGLLLAGLAVVLWLRRGAWAGAPQALIWRAVAAAATLAALALPLIARRDWALPLGRLMDEAAWVLWLYPLGAATLLLGVALWLVRGQSLVRVAAVGIACLVVGALGWAAPGLLVAGALWLALFAACERLWCVLAGLAATLYLGDLYYSLHISLLHKSVVLALSGAALLVLRWLVLRFWGAGNES